jgi:hypothetical protein
MKKRSKKSKIILLFVILLLTSITQNIYNEGQQKFTLNGSDVDYLFDTESNNPLVNPQLPKTSESHPYNDSDTIILCDFEDGNDDISGIFGASVGASEISPGIEGDRSVFFSSKYSFLGYDIPQENITEGTIECYFRPLYFRENSLPFPIMFVDSEPVCEVYIQGNSLFAWHIAERGISTSPTLQSNTTLQLDVTYHIAYSFGSAGQKLYLDGNLVAESNFDEGMCNLTTRWGMGKTSINEGARGVYDMYKISKIQRTSFTSLPPTNPSFSSDGLNPITPPYHIDNDTFLYWDCESTSSSTIFTRTTILDTDRYYSMVDTSDRISQGIWGDYSYRLGYDPLASYRIESPYMYSNMSQGTFEIDFMPFYLDDDGLDYNILLLDSGEPNLFRLFLRGNQLLAQHHNNDTASPLLIANTNLTIDTYYHIAYTFGLLGSKLYLNNQLVAESSCNFGIGNPNLWDWGIGHIDKLFPAIGVYDNLRISCVARDDFSDVYKIDPEFDRNNIYTYLPLYNYFDEDTFMLLDFENGRNTITREHGLSLWDTDEPIINPGILGDNSLLLTYDPDYEMSYCRVTCQYINATMDEGAIDFYFHPTYLANDGREYIVTALGHNELPAYQISIIDKYLYAKHSSNNGQNSSVLKSSTKLEMGKTYHFAYTFGRNGTFLYIDDRLEASSSYNFGIKNPSFWSWRLGFIWTEGMPPNALGLFDFFRVSMTQRTDFSNRPSINSAFSSDDLNLILPPFPPEPAIPILIPSNEGEVSLDGNESVGYAILCGIRDYPGFSADLQYTENDINDYKSFLLEKLHFQEENINILLNSQGTISNINQAFADVKSKMDGNDYLFFTFSGHGSSSVETLEYSWPVTFNYADWQPWDMIWDYEQKYALYTRVHFKSINLQENQDFIYIGDYNNQDYYSTVITGQHTDFWSDWVEASHIYVHLLSDGQGVFEGLEIDKVECMFYSPPFYFHPYDGLETGFSDTDFENLLEGIPGKVISVFDSCFSGAFCRAMQGPNRLLFASCGDKQFALEASSIQNGVFTYEFLQSWDSLYQENMGIPPSLEQVFDDAKTNVRLRSIALGYDQIPMKFDYISGDVIVAPYVEVEEIFPLSSNNLNFSYSAFGIGIGQIEISLYDVEDQNYFTYSISNVPILDNKLNITMPVPDLSDYECIAINGNSITGDEIIGDIEYYGDYSTLFSEAEDWDGDGLSDYDEFLQGSNPWEISNKNPVNSNNSKIPGFGITFILLGSILSINWIFVSVRKKTKIF